MEFASWPNLSTHAGCLTMVLIITQYTKTLPFLKKVPTQLWSLALAFVILVTAHYFSGDLSLSTAVLSIFNAMIVSLAANGGFTILHDALPSLFPTGCDSRDGGSLGKKRH